MGVWQSGSFATSDGGIRSNVWNKLDTAHCGEMVGCNFHASLFLAVLVSCTSDQLPHTSLIRGGRLEGINDKKSDAFDTVHSISAIQVLGENRDDRKVPSSQTLVAMKQCEAALLKPRNDEMLKGPSFCLGLLKQSFGDIEGALVDYNRAVARYPQNGAASYNAAGILESMGRDNEAALKYKVALLVNETSEISLSKLIPLLLRNGRDNEAKSVCITACDSGPPVVRYKAFEQLGSVFHRMGILDKSFDAYKSALLICRNSSLSSDTSDKRLVEALNNAAQAAQASTLRTDRNAAEEYFLRSLEVAPDNADTHTYYGVYLKEENRIFEASTEFRKSIALDPTEKFKDTGYAAVQLASLTGSSTVIKMNDNYVRGLFDGYADRFDSELVGKLQYRGHHHVVDALKNALISKRSSQSSPPLEGIFDFIDIGSGTGLCGELLRQSIPNAHITGVDLSQRMLEKSIGRGCYNKLVLGDAVSYLDKVPVGSVDAIIAADVFIYIGDLEAIFKSSSAALKCEVGFLVFTVEELIPELQGLREPQVHGIPHGFDDIKLPDEDSEGIALPAPDVSRVRLLTCGRFGHSEEYIVESAQRFGFAVSSLRREALRLQSDVPVQSVTFVLQKVGTTEK